MSWKINSQEVADNGGNSITRRLTSSGDDSCTVILSLDADTDISSIVTTEGAVSITKDGTPFFKGVVEKISPVANGSQEMIQIDCVSYWYWLERIVYQQPFKYWNTGTSLEETIMVSKVVLGQDNSGALITASQAIENILDYASGFDGNILTGSIATSANINFPPIEVSGLTCAECLRVILRWLPDAWITWNHSTNGSFNIGRGADAIALPCDITHSAGTVSGRSITSVTIDDLQKNKVAGVVINYEQTETVDGSTKVKLIQDTAGSTSGKNVLVYNIAIKGSSATTQSQYVKTDSIPEQDYSTIPEHGDVTTTWLCKKFPAIGAKTLIDAVWSNIRVKTVRHTIDLDNVAGPGTPPDDTGIYSAGTYPNELLQGSISDSMVGITAAQTLVEIELEWISGSMTASLDTPLVAEMYANDGRVKLYYECVGTNSSTKTYTSVSTESGEEIPAGIATQIYNSMSLRMSSGEIELVENEVTTNAYPGRSIALLDPFPTYGTGSYIQTVTNSVFDGRTSIRFGPFNNRLGPSDLIELMRVGSRSPDGGGYGSGHQGVPQSSARTSSAVEDHGAPVIEGGLMAKNTSTVVQSKKPQVEWCEVSYATATTVDIAEGCVMVGFVNLTTSSTTDPVPAKCLTRLKVSTTFRPIAVTGQTVTNGSKIYVKLTWAAISYASGVSGINEITTKIYECTNAEYYINTSEPTDDDDYSYVLVAEIAISGSEMTISNHYPGVITAPSITLPYTTETGAGFAINHKWFAVSKVTESTVDVAAGKIYSAVLPTSPGSGLSTTAIQEYNVTAASGESVTDGQFIVLRIEWDSTPDTKTTYNKLATSSGLTEGGAGPDPTLARGYLGDGFVSGIEGWNTDPVYFSVTKTQQHQIASASIVVTSTPSLAATNESDIILAEIDITAGVLTVMQRHDGAVFLPGMPFLSYGDGAID